MVSILGAARTPVAEKLTWACHSGSLFLHAQLSQNPGRGRARRTSPRAFSERCGRSGQSGQEPSGGRGGGGAGRRGAVWAGHGQAQLIQPRGADLPAQDGCLSDLTQWYPRLSIQWPQEMPVGSTPRSSQKQVRDNWYSTYIKGNSARKKRDHWQVQELESEGLTGSSEPKANVPTNPIFCFESRSDSKPSHVEKGCGARVSP